MQHFTKKELTCLTELMEAEVLAYKKAKIYAAILTDTALAESLNRIGDQHKQSFERLYGIVGGKV